MSADKSAAMDRYYRDRLAYHMARGKTLPAAQELAAQDTERRMR